MSDQDPRRRQYRVADTVLTSYLNDPTGNSEDMVALLAAAVAALLAIADQLDDLRVEVSALNEGLSGDHSHLRWINDWLKKIAER